METPCRPWRHGKKSKYLFALRSVCIPAMVKFFLMLGSILKNDTLDDTGIYSPRWSVKVAEPKISVNRDDEYMYV